MGVEGCRGKKAVYEIIMVHTMRERVGVMR